MTQKIHSITKKISKASLAAALSIALCVPFGWASHINNHEHGIMMLPNEILAHTFAFLSTRDLGKLALVSPRFKYISELPSLWKEKIIGVNTKEEYISYLKRPIIGYEFETYDIYYHPKIIFISPFDLLIILKTGRLSINGSIFELKISSSNNSKCELLSIIGEMEWPYDGLQIILDSDCSVKLEYSSPIISACVDFQKIQGNMKSIKLIAPDLRIGSASFRNTGPELGHLMMARLNCLNDHYKDLHFCLYWGYNYPFEFLENCLCSFHNFINASESVKNEAVNYFVQKYVDFRAKKSGSDGDMHYADSYLQKLLQNIKTDLETDFVSTPYIPPLEYVVKNKKIPKYMKSEFYQQSRQNLH